MKPKDKKEDVSHAREDLLESIQTKSPSISAFSHANASISLNQAPAGVLGKIINSPSSKPSNSGLPMDVSGK
ncbi:hypothetical protein BK004_01710 [bacterium CG10_46_32]|nr:MAG: hypothetical protein BK004_01710 [bacterium CG10_46_32]PIR56258.1 MAG: hypothetical protein COU73_01740 [Parcubacteria group bacterium CG10_big_fil_rev_8_21_14_0_10_46_32]